MIAALAIVAAVWASEPRGQEYALDHGGSILFWIPDERAPQYGTVFYLWGYFPCIVSDGMSYRFRDVSWTYGER